MHPNCEYCDLPAQYDFISDETPRVWRYGCTKHWMEHRVSKQIGPGHARHLTKGVQPTPRQTGELTGDPIPKTVFVKPSSEAVPRTMVSAGSPASGVPRVRTPRKTGTTKDFFDLPRADEPDRSFSPKPGSAMAVALEIMEKGEGATVDELRAAIGPNHDPVKLFQFFNEKRGWGFKKDPNTGKIQVER